MSNINLQCLLGMQCNDFVMIVADQTTSHSIMLMKDDEEKIHKISDKIMMGVIGEQGDTSQFSEYIAKNIQLYKMRNRYELGTSAASMFIHRNLADNLRGGGAYFVNLLVGGYDETGPELYFLDYLGSCVKVPYCTHGYGGYPSLSILDRYHRDNLTQNEAYEVMKKCVQEIQKRLFISLPRFEVKVVSKDGIQTLPPIESK